MAEKAMGTAGRLLNAYFWESQNETFCIPADEYMSAGIQKKLIVKTSLAAELEIRSRFWRRRKKGWE